VVREASRRTIYANEYTGQESDQIVSSSRSCDWPESS
jgi:hypothetical protein